MRLFQVDAFTKNIYGGNPAGVCLPGGPMDEMSMQNIAMEMNLSETAFLYKNDDIYELRWFTPEAEIDFCGHATLSSAHILWEQGSEPSNKTISFNTRAGILTASLKGGMIEMDFPSLKVSAVEGNGAINDALGTEPLFTGTDGKRYLLEVGSLAELEGLNPDFGKLKAMGRTAFMVTCRSGDGKYDFYSRFFAPALGINEDPVTGSAHSYLTPYWADKLDKKIMRSFQVSKRGGEMECELKGDRVLLRGYAVTVFEALLK